MATWTRKKVLTAGGSIKQIVSSGTKIYYVDATGFTGNYVYNGDIYEYDPAGNTNTKIIDQSNVGFANMYGIAWHNGNLYTLGLVQTGIGVLNPRTGFTENKFSLLVKRWTGVVDGLTTVHTMYADQFEGDIATYLGRLYSDSTTMVAVGIGDPNDPTQLGAQNHLSYSSDGSAWSVGSFSVNPTVNFSWEFNYDMSFPQGIFEYFYMFDASSQVMKFSGTGFSVFNASPAIILSLIGSTPGDTLHWETAFNSTHYLNTAMTTSTQLNSAISAINQINMPYMCGLDPISPNGSNLYSLGGGPSWNLLDTINQAPFNPNFASPGPSIVRMADTNVYLIGLNGSTAVYEVWERSEGIPFTVAGTGRLWIYRYDGESWVSRGVKT